MATLALRHGCLHALLRALYCVRSLTYLVTPVRSESNFIACIDLSLLRSLRHVSMIFIRSASSVSSSSVNALRTASIAGASGGSKDHSKSLVISRSLHCASSKVAHITLTATQTLLKYFMSSSECMLSPETHPQVHLRPHSSPPHRSTPHFSLTDQYRTQQVVLSIDLWHC